MQVHIATAYMNCLLISTDGVCVVTVGWLSNRPGRQYGGGTNLLNVGSAGSSGVAIACVKDFCMDIVQAISQSFLIIRSAPSV